MAANDELTLLLRQMAATASPLQRLKILGRAWRTVRRLSPTARQDLAARVGIDGAGEVLERLAARRGRLSPAALLGALEALRSTEPEAVRAALRELRDADGRRALLDRGWNALEARIASGGDKPEPAAEPEVDAETPQPAARAPAAVVAGGPRPVAAAAIPLSEDAPRARPKGAPPGGARPVAPRRVASVDVAAIGPSPVSPPYRPAPEALAAQAPEPPARPRRRPGPLAASAAGSLIAAVTDEPVLMRRFRVLADRIEDARDLDVTELERLLDAFPENWARRRALCRLLDAHIPDDLHRAVYLVERLDSAASRRWCVARILHVWPLSDFERDALLRRRSALTHGGLVGV